MSAFNRLCGVDVQEISPREVDDLFPLARADDVLAGFYVPDDGRANPVDVTMALAKGARMHGATDRRGRAGHRRSRAARGAVDRRATPYGDIEAEYVVNCAGMWARQLGEQAGVTIPLQAAEHYYLHHRARSPGIDARCRCSRTRRNYGYFREEGGGLMVGLFEPVCAPWNVERHPRRLLLRRAPAGLGPDGALPRGGDGPGADLRRGRRPQVLLRPGELHPDLRPWSARRPSCATTSSPPG